MKNTSISLFRQILDLVPKHEFEKIIMKHNGDKRKQSFDSWAHFVSMVNDLPSFSMSRNMWNI